MDYPWEIMLSPLLAHVLWVVLLPGADARVFDASFAANPAAQWIDPAGMHVAWHSHWEIRTTRLPGERASLPSEDLPSTGDEAVAADRGLIGRLPEAAAISFHHTPSFPCIHQSRGVRLQT